jgi:DNA-binding NarL/FixJ family response regulator
MGKLYLVIYGEQKLYTDFIHNNLERLHQYDVLFSTSEEDKLFAGLTDEVKLLIYHTSHTDERLIRLVETVLNNFKGIKILLYSPNTERLERLFSSYTGRIKLIPAVKGYADFFGALKELLPGHKNHFDEEVNLKQKHEYLNEGFDKIKKSRKKILILKFIADGMKAKEMEGLDGLKINSIHTYIERMMEETGCRNHTELVLQAKDRGII